MASQPKDPSQDGHKKDNQPANPQQHGLQPRQMGRIMGRTMGRSMNRFEQSEQSNSTKSGLDKTVQAKMENSFQSDFSDVNITQNSSEASSMGAMAFTQGNDVHFAPGQYNPNTAEGQELIGHELTHVIQQKQGRVKATTQAKGVAVNNDPALENEADVMGKKAASGQHAIVQKQSRRGEVQKKDDDSRVQASEINYEPNDFASDLRDLNQEIEIKFNGALDQFERALQMKKTTPDYLNVTWGILKSEVIGATGAIPVYGTYISKALSMLDKYYTEYKKAEANTQHNESLNFSLNQGDLINERSKLLNEAVNQSEREYTDELNNRNGNSKISFMQATYDSFKSAYKYIIDDAQDNIEIGFYKNFLSDIRGELYIGFEGDWLNPVLKTVKITKSGHDVGITQRLNKLYEERGFIPLNEFKIKKIIVHPNNMPGGLSALYLDENNNMIGGGESSKLILNEYWKSTTKPLKSVYSMNGIKLPIPVTLD